MLFVHKKHGNIYTKKNLLQNLWKVESVKVECVGENMLQRLKLNGKIVHLEIIFINLN